MVRVPPQEVKAIATAYPPDPLLAGESKLPQTSVDVLAVDIDQSFLSNSSEASDRDAFGSAATRARDIGPRAQLQVTKLAVDFAFLLP